jgi:hypothetical protein
MKNGEQTTHRHKRLGAVVLLRSTAELAQVLLPASGERLWVKVSELSDLTHNGKTSRLRPKP